MTSQTWLTDTVPSTRYPIYTRLNANDVLPEPLTPLGASLAWIQHILPGWSDGYVTGDAFTPAELSGEDISPVAGLFYGRLYINQTVVRVLGIRMGIGWQGVDAAYFRADSPPHVERPEDHNEAISERMHKRTEWTLSTTTFPELDEDRKLADRCRAERPDLSTLSAGALIARARSVMPLERLVWRGEVLASNQAAVGPGIVSQLIGEADPSLAVKLIALPGDVDSAAPSYALWDLSRLVREDPALSATFDAGADGLLDMLAEKHPAFHERFTAFLTEYGYRGPSEWDIGADSWETKPELPLALIDRLRQLDEDSSPQARQAAKADEVKDATAQALALLGDDEEAKQTLQAAVASARRFAGWRERGKTNCIKVLNEARVALTELGRRLHEQGHLKHPRQVFMALDEELETLVFDPASLTETLAARETQWHELLDLKEPTFVAGGKPLTPLAELSRRSGETAATSKPGDVLRGGPGASGVARGRARVVLDTGEISEFQPGEILVAPQTDPSWTPLFMVSAGVVVDAGAMGSHAMIVSRELGIPCAAGVADATRKIPDGTLVEVDGSTGTVTILAE